MKNEPLATLTMVYHPRTEKLKPRLNEMGIRLAFSTNSTLRQQLKHNTTCDQPKGSVYVINCSACPKVYVGQTGRHTEERMIEHSRGSDGAIHHHQNTNQGHRMDLQNPTDVFLSDCHHTRTTVEAALMFVSPTVQNNTASTSNEYRELVAPVICRSTKFNWRKLATCMPHLDKSIIPNNVKHLFDNQQQTVIDPGGQEANEATLPLEGIHVSHRTRSRLPMREALQL